MIVQRVIIIVFALLFLFNLSVLFAHPGRIDRNNGHKGPGGYHFHDEGRLNMALGNNAKQPKTAAQLERVYILTYQDEQIYHLKTCEAIKDKKVTEVTKAVAKSSDYHACSICRPS